MLSEKLEAFGCLRDGLLPLVCFWKLPEEAADYFLLTQVALCFSCFPAAKQKSGARLSWMTVGWFMINIFNRCQLVSTGTWGYILRLPQQAMGGRYKIYIDASTHSHPTTFVRTHLDSPPKKQTKHTQKNTSRRFFCLESSSKEHQTKTQMLHVGTMYLDFPLNVAIVHLI